ncbi:hemolymph lipopolysaccharide-binding protein-like [Periplaneta americana]|uniref:hemolymph lipopolysaccharide-binding protein-like n=1 Tax=Periplaneta americana TaxID=6978 RepID=UPI0037E80EA2
MAVLVLGAACLLAALSIAPCHSDNDPDIGVPCLDERTATVRFSLNSRRNQTGHWIAQLDMEHDSQNMEANSWEVDIHHSTVTCDGTEAVKFSATVTVPPPPTPAPPGYELAEGLGYYKLHSTLLIWEEARLACQREGANLAVLNSEEEAAQLERMYRANPNLKDNAFLGFHDLFQEGHYVTIFGDNLNVTGFDKWAPGQPDNYGDNPGEDCGAFMRHSEGLNDLPCNTPQPFFCEISL